MPRRDDRHSSGSGSGSRRYDGYRYQEVDPEYDARTYTSSDPRHTMPVPQSQPISRTSLVNYDYGSDDSPIIVSAHNVHKKKDRRRSRSISPEHSKKEKKELKKSKKKKKTRSVSRERENPPGINKKHKSKRTTPPSPHLHSQQQVGDDIRVLASPSKRKTSPPRQYANNPSPPREPVLSPPRAYQSAGGKIRKDFDAGSRLHRTRDRSPNYRHPKSPTSPFG